MKIRSYNKELAISTLLFSKLFRNITINRVLENDKVEACKVACVIGSRSRVLKSFETGQESTHITTPMISITRTGINRDPGRLSNLHNEVLHATNASINYDLYTPNPVNLNFKVTIYARYIADLDMILSNFMVFFNNDIFVSSVHPKYTNLRYYSQIVMNDNINETLNETIANTQLDLVTAELTFTFKTYIFGGNRQVPAAPYNISRPITSITEVTAIDENGEPIIDPETGEISVITTQTTATKTEIYEGFIPLINSIYIDIHAVPCYDPFRWLRHGQRINYDFRQYFYDFDNEDPNQNDGRIYGKENADYDIIDSKEWGSLDWIIEDAVLNN